MLIKRSGKRIITTYTCLEEITKELVYAQYHRELVLSVFLKTIETQIVISHTGNQSSSFGEFYFVSLGEDDRKRLNTILEVREYIRKKLHSNGFKEHPDITSTYEDVLTSYSFEKEVTCNFSDSEDIIIDLDTKDEILVSELAISQPEYKLILIVNDSKREFDCSYMKQEKMHILTLGKTVIQDTSFKRLKESFGEFLIRQFRYLGFQKISIYKGALDSIDHVDVRKNVITEGGTHKYLNLPFGSDNIGKSKTIHTHFSLGSRSLTLGRVGVIGLPGPLINEHILEYESHFKQGPDNNLYLFLYESEREIYNVISSKIKGTEYVGQENTHTVIKNEVLTPQVICNRIRNNKIITNWFIDWDTISSYTPYLIIELIKGLRNEIQSKTSLKITISFTFSRRGSNSKEVNQFLEELTLSDILDRQQFFIDLSYNVKEESSLRVCRLENHKGATYNFFSEYIAQKYKVELLECSNYTGINRYPMSQVTFKV